MALAFFAIGIIRYISGLPLGLSIDGVLFLVFLALLVKKNNKPDWSKAARGITWASLIWFAYNFLQLFNPQAVSKAAWFYAMRGVSLYMVMIIPLVLVLWDDRKHLQNFVDCWLVFSLLGTLKGIMQNTIGPDFAEQAWLDAGAATQHILFGKLRVFSFYSDAGQFGASQGHAGIMALILALSPKNPFKRKLWYGFSALMAFYGMMISGTRGAMAVPAAGFITYLFLSKNFKVLLLGLFCMFSVFFVLKYTSLFHNIYAVRRMRTGLDPNEPSLQVRIRNQKKLAVYLRSRPFGGGVGSAGNWGLRFSPNTFLAQTPTDSWYVRIWAEEGVVGLYLHLAILFYIAIHGGYYIWHLKDAQLRQMLMGLHGGMMGIYAASYGNGVLGQMPTGILLYTSMAFIFLGPQLDRTPQKDTS
ncbi:MAG: O-antigen ligase family protein [Bacteroidia bacterium]|nr:O-antigen ligase family protein [Bacteroidia bacterium]